MQKIRHDDLNVEKVGKQGKLTKLKEGLLAFGKLLKNKLPMKETAVAVGIASMAMPACTTRFEPSDIETETGEDSPADIHTDDTSVPDLPSEIDADHGGEPTMECLGIFSEIRTMLRINQGETVKIGNIPIKVTEINPEDASYQISCVVQETPEETAELTTETITGSGGEVTRDFMEQNVRIRIMQPDINYEENLVIANILVTTPIPD